MVELSIVGDNKMTDGSHMSYVNGIEFDMDGNAKLTWTDFTYNSSGKMMHTGMTTYKDTTLSQIGGERTYPWNVALNAGTGNYTFSDSNMMELADTSTHLTCMTLDTCLKYKLTGLTSSLEKLGFGT